MNLVHRSTLGAACLVTLVACSRTERTYDDKSGAGDRAGTTTVTGADLRGLSSDLAVDRVVAARCQREAACSNIGSDKHFTNPDTCARELHSKVGADLTASECPRGIDAKELDECMESIRTESCNNPVDTISRLAACRTSEMCVKADAKSR